MEHTFENEETLGSTKWVKSTAPKVLSAALKVWLQSLQIGAFVQYFCFKAIEERILGIGIK